MPLSESINRTLIGRLGLAALLLCAIFAALAYFTGQQRIESSLSELARVQGERFNRHIYDLLDRPDALTGPLLQESFETFAQESGPTIVRQGRFVLARIYDQQGSQLAELSVEGAAELDVIRERLDAAGIAPLAIGEFRVVTAQLADSPFVGVAVPLTNRRRQVAAQLVGVFAISDAALAQMRADILRTMLYVVGIVSATALIIYPIISGLIGRLSRQTMRLLDSNLEILQVLGGAIAKRDSDTDAHNYRVTVYAVRLAESLGLSRDRIRSLIKGALLHDVGKLGIRDNILLKPGKLTDEEFEVMKTHVEHGLDITERAGWLKDAQDVVGGHHEKFGGAGYPQGLTGDQIPVTARIFAIVDVFDALTSRRPYKEPMTFDAAMDILEQGRGRHFDPALLDAFGAIARPLYDQYSGRDDDEPRRALDRITVDYFKRDMADLLS